MGLPYHQVDADHLHVALVDMACMVTGYLGPRYLPCCSRIALAQSIGSKNDTNPNPRALFSPFVRITYTHHITMG
jgi:hypothetical protein